MHHQPAFHFSIQNTTHHTTRACVVFHREEFNDFDLHIINDNVIARNFTSLRQMYNYLRAVHGHAAAMLVIEPMVDHVQCCKNIG
jgi:hypothetical protein